MSSTTLRRALRSLLWALVLLAAAPGMRAAETDPFRRTVADLMASAGRPGTGAATSRARAHRRLRSARRSVVEDICAPVYEMRDEAFEVLEGID